MATNNVTNIIPPSMRTSVVSGSYRISPSLYSATSLRRDPAFARYYARLQRSIDTAPKQMMRDIERLQVEFAKSFFIQLRINLRSNKFKFKLRPTTLRIKARTSPTAEGRAGLPFVDTGEYLRNIQLDGKTVRIAPSVHQASGLTFEELYRILEFGRRDRHINPRPLWRLTFAELQPYFRKQLSALHKRYNIAIRAPKAYTSSAASIIRNTQRR